MRIYIQAFMVMCACNFSFPAFANMPSVTESPISIPFSQQQQNYQYSGVIYNYVANDFSFYGHQGQKVTMLVKSDSAKLWVNIKYPETTQAADVSDISVNPNIQNTYTLPSTGQYHISIGEYPDNSKRNATQNYSFNITLK